MKNSVYYLIYNDLPSGEGQGLVFPNEIEYDYFSLGIHTIQEKTPGILYSTYNYLGFHNEEPTIVELNRIKDEIAVASMGNNLYFEAKYQNWGSFIYIASPLHKHYSSYVGNNKDLINHNPLWRLTPFDEKYLEWACIYKNFYLTGFTNFPDNELSNKDNNLLY